MWVKPLERINKAFKMAKKKITKKKSVKKKPLKKKESFEEKLVHDERAKVKLKASYVLWSFVAIAVLLILVYVFTGFNFDVNSPEVDEWKGTTSVSEVLNIQFNPSSDAGERVVNVLGSILSFVLGSIPNIMLSLTNEMGALIVLICIWAMLALVFGDIFKNFSSLSASTSWAVAILLVIAAANLGVLNIAVARLTYVFAFLGAFAVYAGLFASIIAWFAVEWGIGGLSEWIMRRKQMKALQKEDQEAMQKTNTILNAMRNLNAIGEEIQGSGDKKTTHTNETWNAWYKAQKGI